MRARCATLVPLACLALLLAVAPAHAEEDNPDEKLCRNVMEEGIRGFTAVIRKEADVNEFMAKFFTKDMVGEYPSFTPQTRDSLGRFFATHGTPPGCGLQFHWSEDRMLAHNNKALIKDNKNLRVACSFSVTYHYVVYSTKEVMEPCVFRILGQFSTKINPATRKMEVFNLALDGADLEAGLGACFARCSDAPAFAAHETSEL